MPPAQSIFLFTNTNRRIDYVLKVNATVCYWNFCVLTLHVDGFWLTIRSAGKIFFSQAPHCEYDMVFESDRPSRDRWWRDNRRRFVLETVCSNEPPSLYWPLPKRSRGTLNDVRQSLAVASQLNESFAHVRSLQSNGRLSSKCPK